MSKLRRIVRGVFFLLVILLKYFHGSLQKHEALNDKFFIRFTLAYLPTSFQVINPLYTAQCLITDAEVKSPLVLEEIPVLYIVAL